MDPERTILHCADIHKTYVLDERASSRLEVLRGIDLRISEGELITIVGASGSGKSTLLHILGGLDRPTKGKVFWNERDISLLNDDALASLRGVHVGFVFQFHHLLPEFTTLENVMMPMMIRGERQHDAARAAKVILGAVGLSSRLDHKPGELSGGEQQRVAVARALVNNPSVVFADEPTGNLDSANSQQLFQLIVELNRGKNLSFVIVTHNESFAAEAHRSFRMEDGKLVSQ
ncbi:MAG TPA: ABC transporter ATP-binding protein [Bacteroidota bacterium]|nr:ABC transporter ATP-binding protein [Bacteroidota bacterium]